MNSTWPSGTAGRPEHRQGDGSDQQHGGQHGKDALGNHMNSFSFFRSL